MNTWKDKTRNVAHKAEAHAFVVRHWKVTLLMGIFSLLSAGLPVVFLDDPDSDAQSVLGGLYTLFYFPAVIGCLHVAASARPQEFFYRRVFGYGFSRFFVSLLALLPLVLVYILGYFIISIIWILITKSSSGGNLVGMLFCFLNPWAIRLSMVIPVMVVHDIPFGGAIGRTWRASKGYASRIFYACYLPVILAGLVNIVLVILVILVGGFDQPRDGRIAAIFVSQPLNIYFSSYCVGVMISLAHEIMETRDAKAIAATEIRT